MEIEPKIDVEKLLERQASHCVSIYIPTSTETGEVKGNMIRFKNAVNEAKRQLAYLNNRQTYIGYFLSPLYNLLEEESFWWRLDQGLAVFLSSSLFLHYKLPFTFHEYVNVNKRFYIKPLLHLLTNKLQYNVLTLDLSGIRLFRYTPFSSQEIVLPNVPRNIEDALKDDVYERHMNYHTGAKATTEAGPSMSIFHAQGGGTDSKEREYKERVWRFFNKLENALLGILNQEGNPLLLVGVDYQVALYRQLNTYPHLLPFDLQIDPHALTLAEIHKQVREIINAQREKERQADIERYFALKARQLATNSIRLILPAAQTGRIDTLFVSDDMHIWGRYHPETTTIHLEEEATPYNQELTDVAAYYTLINNGNIYNLPPAVMPEAAATAAILRY
jgi:hypothetical protein